jgi:hypothetical protein
MTRTITASMRDHSALNDAVQFLTAEYGMQDADMMVQLGRDNAASDDRTLSIVVNDDELDEICQALTSLGAVVDAAA